MMIMTAEHDVPTTSTENGHVATTRTKPVAVNRVLRPRSSISSFCSRSSDTITFSTISAATTSTMKSKKRVSFSLQQTAYFAPPEHLLSPQERKDECWYSEAELNVSRDEARTAIQALHHQLQLDAAAVAKVGVTNTTSTGTSTSVGTQSSSSAGGHVGSWVLRCPQDQSKIVCLRGVEKYADAEAKYAGQKRLVRSVLQQQSLNNKDVHISLVSRTLSEPFKEVARYYAMKSAEELEYTIKLEETERRQREEVATVLLLIMGQQQQNTAPSSPRSSPTAAADLMIPLSSQRAKPNSTTSMSSKRSSPTNSPWSERNVKPCIPAISNRMSGL